SLRSALPSESGSDRRDDEEQDRGDHAAAKRPHLRRKRPQDALFAPHRHAVPGAVAPSCWASRFAARRTIVGITDPARKLGKVTARFSTYRANREALAASCAPLVRSMCADASGDGAFDIESSDSRAARYRKCRKRLQSSPQERWEAPSAPRSFGAATA